MEECVKLEYAETAVPVKRRKIKGILPLLFVGSLVIVAADQGMNALRKPDLFRREHTVAEEKVKAYRTSKHLVDMEEPVGKCVSLSETSTVKIPMEVSEDSEAAFLLETERQAGCPVRTRPEKIQRQRINHCRSGSADTGQNSDGNRESADNGYSVDRSSDRGSAADRQSGSGPSDDR